MKPSPTPDRTICPKCQGQLLKADGDYSCLQCGFADSGLPPEKAGRYYTEEAKLRIRSLAQCLGSVPTTARWLGCSHSVVYSVVRTGPDLSLPSAHRPVPAPARPLLPRPIPAPSPAGTALFTVIQIYAGPGPAITTRQITSEVTQR